MAEEPTTIQIVGETPPYPYQEIKPLVVKIAGAFYWKTDENLIKIKTGKGIRFFRKNSPLLVKTTAGKYLLKSECLKTEDGIWLKKNDPGTVEVDGKPTRSEYVVNIDDKNYLKSDPRLTTCPLSKKVILKARAIQLSTVWHPDKWVSADQEHRLVQTADGYCFKDQATLLIRGTGAREWFHRSHRIFTTERLVNVFDVFQDATNPQPDRILTAQALVSEVISNFEVIEEAGGLYVHKGEKPEVVQQIIDFHEAKGMKETEAVRKLLNAKYSDTGPDENQAKTIAMKYQVWPGKHPIATAHRKTNVFSKTTAKTGGMKYTFGVEIETSAGLLSSTRAEQLGIHVVGDRSIGAAEYVTGILHGDAGIDHVGDMCAALAKSTLVDDRCGVHVHVGGVPNTPHVETPELNRQFAVNAIKLGCQIEKDLYEISPMSRKPSLHHCHSIMRYADINEENWKTRLGSFVFGPKENWHDSGKEGYKFPMGAYEFGTEGRTGSASLGHWCGGRYKWLNLVPCLTRSSAKTCEIRLFAGTTNFRKIHNYILISMAFVWFADNRVRLIERGGVTLESMLAEAYAKHPAILKSLFAFIKLRRDKFNRDVLTEKLKNGLLEYPTFIKDMIKDIKTIKW